MKATTISGRIWILEAGGKLIEDIDTDQIFHNVFLHITDISQMGQHTLGNLPGWEDFPSKVNRGDILLAGRNFGAGSSRQQAVDCFIALGVSAIVAPSFGAIYFRNAVNSGFPVIRYENLYKMVEGSELNPGDDVSFDVQVGRGQNKTRGIDLAFEPMSEVQLQIYSAGNLFNFAK
ncbi:3-isopropylmalate dehydratase [Acidobacteriota bacterium]